MNQNRQIKWARIGRIIFGAWLLGVRLLGVGLLGVGLLSGESISHAAETADNAPTTKAAKTAPGEKPAGNQQASSAKLPWPAPSQVLRLWPGDAPGLVASPNTESIVNERIRNVSVPELWVYLPPKPERNRVAFMICPGGGYSHLAMGLHIGNVVKLFGDQGVVVFGLKYRTRYGANNAASDATTDCARAVRIIRQHADEWGINPARVGVQGYSAGGNICLNLLGSFDAGNPGASDPVEKYSCRPDFMALMCPWPNGKPATAYPVLKNPPPVFIASAQDDKTAPTSFALQIADAVKRQGGEVQLFIVPTGGHGAFHIGAGNGPGTKWPDAFKPMLLRQSESIEALRSRSCPGSQR
ncbi:MAG: alpha/beta hydrolase [Candidatus Sumerlaeota bacterium]|nr:alpha/beta hydrolase [Candidatus Sumerlaeota bacterium]